MANSIDAFIPEMWSARSQKLREKTLVSLAVSNFEEQDGLKFGDRVHRPVSPDFVTDDYVNYTDATAQDVTTTDEYLDIDQKKVISWDLDLNDKTQSKYDVEAKAMDRATYQIKNTMDASRMKQTLFASYTADAGDVGGSAGTPATVTAANVNQFFSSAKATLRTNDVEDDVEWYAIITPKISSLIEQSFQANGFGLADATLKNGYKGNAFGLAMYESTNVTHTQTITLATVVNTNTVTIAGVTFNFATVATNPGDVDLGASDTDAAANFVLAFNKTGTPSATTYIELSSANRKKIKRLNAVATSALGVITIQFAGAVAVSKSGAPITLGTQVANLEIGRKGAVDMVVQRYPEIQRNKIVRQTGYTYLVTNLYGLKTFTEGAERMLNGKVVA